MFQSRISRSHMRLAQRNTIPTVLAVSLATWGRISVWRLKAGLDVHPTFTGMLSAHRQTYPDISSILWNDDQLALVRLFLFFRSWWRRLFFSADGFYDARKWLTMSRWLPWCFDTEHSRYLVIKLSRCFTFLKSCCFVVALVTRIKNEWLGNASLLPFAGRRLWVTELQWGAKCTKSLI